MGTEQRIQTYAEFWPFYLSQHLKPWTKRFHVAGTFAAIGVVAYSLATVRLSLLWFTLPAAYGPAWYSHFFIEKNRPATFTYPFWSFISDFRMTAGVLMGTL